VDQGFFYGASFLVAPREMMPHMSTNHESWATNDGNHVMVPNPNEMISIVTIVTRANMKVPEPQGVNERSDL
jgi:hypothetical protein